MKKNVLEYLEETVKRFPDKKAFCDEREQLSFCELYHQARSIGSALARRGITKKPVLVYMEKSPSAVMAFFGAVYGGCFYVPLDEEMPYKRIQLIMENTQAEILICDEHTQEKVKKSAYHGEVCLCSELIRTEEDDEALRAVRNAQLDTDLVYVLFTSGSTGVPKGVAGHHRGVLDYIDQLADVMGFDENSVFGNQTPIYFDASMKEIYGTLKCGATTWMIPRKLFLLIAEMVHYLNEHRINTICWVVSALTMLSSFGAFEEEKPEYLHTIGFGGEVFPVSQFNIWKETLPEAKFVNLYGPTEATGVSTYYIAERKFCEGESIPIGRTFDNTEIFLLKEDGTLAGKGESGEIYIRGTGVACGYYNDSVKTKEVFVQNPLHGAYPETVYKTGDIACYNEDGDLVFISRKDHQIKHMGHRVELGEIESNAGLVGGVAACCCVYAQDDGKIILFYTGSIDRRAFTIALKEALPKYMVPNCMIKLEGLPMTATGKLDRPAMLEIYKKERERTRKSKEKKNNGNT
ncbi:MAG: amino acid adenylation domain-containing protein [Eubacterium sp.]|nr:amino acid adenylation domain-containing protein [Eubacterium sp.]